MNKFLNLILILIFAISINSCELKKKEAKAIKSESKETSIQAFVDDFIIAFNNTDIDKIDQLSASPFFFYVGGKLSSGKTYGAIVDFDAIKESGWRYTTIDDSEIFYQDDNSAQIRLGFTRYNDMDEAIVSSNVIWTLIKNDNKWKIKSAIILENIALAKV